MKKNKIYIILTLMFLIILNSCSPTKTNASVNIDIDKLGENLAKNVIFEDELSILADNVISTIYKCEEAVKTVAYAGGGATAEEIVILEAPDLDTAKTIKSKMEQYLASQIISFTDYNSAELVKLNKSILRQEGKYIIYCISSDYSNVTSIIDESIN